MRLLAASGCIGLAAGVFAVGLFLVDRPVWLWPTARSLIGVAAIRRGEELSLAFSRLRGDAGFFGKWEHRRLTEAAAFGGLVIGFSLIGVIGASVGAGGAVWITRIAIRRRRAAIIRSVDRGAGDLALALAASLTTGQSVRGALLSATYDLEGPIASELERVALDLRLGMSTHGALAELLRRVASPALATVVGAIELQRGAGGDLAKLLRELAEAFRRGEQSRKDARVATAQARLTAAMVAAVPLVAGVLAELVHPGMLIEALSFAPAALMMAVAGAMQLVGLILIQRLTRVSV